MLRSTSAALLTALSLSCHSGGGRPLEDSSGPQAPPSFDALVADLEHREGLFDLWLDRDRGQVWMALGPASGEGATGGVLAECLYVEGLTSGLGSNDVGLDRGQVGPTRHVRFRRLGPRVLVEALNHDFRAQSDNPNERSAADQSFATSVLWAGDVAATASDGRVLIDLTSFVVRDAHGSGRSLTASGGNWRLADERSFLEADETLVFPDNVELEARLTFAGEGASREIREVTPDPTSVTLVQHHSFVRLPDADYRPRVWDPRAGSFSTSFVDVAAAPGSANRVSYANRFRLAKADPDAELSDPVEPLVYYVDNGAPEPVRSALVEGASWWKQAFEAAGFRDAFRVEVLPEGVHPLDVRYNVIQWVHRSSRGWSYGGGVHDPRTGEMIKGHVILGSLRVRQDRMIFEGLVGTRLSGTGHANDPVEAALARIRQLSAHEVGHTLGLAHNFAASTYDGRASVMDYPAPLVRLGDGEHPLDLASAYAVGIGSWDRFAVAHLYGDGQADDQEGKWGDRLLDEARAAGHIYLSDADSRPAGAAEPRGNLWDNGADPIQELAHLLEVRRVALEEFGPDRIAEGSSTALFAEVLMPVFFLHRYQVEAVAKLIGGRHYQHASAHELEHAPKRLRAQEQRLALQRLMECLRVTGDLPDHVAALLAPSTIAEVRRREAFAGRADPLFDRAGLAEASWRHTLGAILQPERLERVAEQHRFEASQLGLAELFGVLEAELFADAAAGDARTAGWLAPVIADELMALVQDARASREVRDAAEAALQRTMLVLARGRPSVGTVSSSLLRELQRFLERDQGALEPRSRKRELPPGSPIGCSHG